MLEIWTCTQASSGRGALDCLAGDVDYLRLGKMREYSKTTRLDLGNTSLEEV
jgi:hypothetical protein